ncbi:2OG-Fe(II) oxygenase family protein [Marinicaulis aureus]|uniref:2OG-Fe(II) oxygenase family protein n=1 Tax=Hyphococcus aureus TaxID=2666033 RepID=A0ABW1KRA2_9PROT
MEEHTKQELIVHHEVRDIFPTNIIVAELKDAPALNAALKETILARKEVSEGLTRSNVLGWHSDSKMLKWGGPAAQTLAKAMMQLCGRHTKDLGAKSGRSRYRMAMDMWANVSPAGASNQYHAHPSCLWSGVYYVDDGGDLEGGPLVLLDPRFPMNRMYGADLVFADDNGAHQSTKVSLTPEPGRLVIFPSWLMHGVRPHAGERDRISVAMNLAALPSESASMRVNLAG